MMTRIGIVSFGLLFGLLSWKFCNNDLKSITLIGSGEISYLSFPKEEPKPLKY